MPLIFYGTISTIDTRPLPIKIIFSNVSSGWDISGVSSSGYTIYGINTDNVVCTMNITVNLPTTMYLFMVGAGGAGGYDIGGGGGGGDVIQAVLTIPVCTNQTITCYDGTGGSAEKSSSVPTYLNNGGNTYISGLPIGTVISNYPTTLSYTTTAVTTITAFGGGYGGHFDTTMISGSIGGSSGGIGAYGASFNTTTSSSTVVTSNWNSNFTFINNANRGGYNLSYKLPAGGGGAGTVGGNCISTGTTRAGNGGDGIQCTLPGISTYNPLGTPYGNYYWGGGGGGGGNNDGTSGSPGTTNGYAGNGGLGGGGGGGTYNSVPAGTGGSGLNNGSPGGTTTSNPGAGPGGAGGKNTGGGGGGGSGNQLLGSGSGAGGSGILLIAFGN